MVGTTKRCIRKVLGKRQVDDEKLNTILASIEAAINSRPLTQDDGPETLTSAHFLHGGRLNTIPTGPEPTLTKSLTKKFRLQQQVVDDFGRDGQRSTCWNFALTTRFDNPVEEKRSFALETSSCMRRCDPAICGKGVGSRSCDQAEMGKREVILPTYDGGRLARPFQLIIPLEVDQGGGGCGGR